MRFVPIRTAPDERVRQMTEYDRGAYTPQADAPLQFDARGPRGRKPMPMTLIGSGAVLVVLLGALALHYRHDAKPSADTERPVGEPIAQVKAPAPAAAQPKDATGSVDVFGGAKPAAQAPTFAAAPEAPKPRAQLTIQAAEPTAIRSAPLATTSTSTPPPVAVAKAAPAPAPTPAAHPAAAYTAPTLASVAKPAPVATKPNATDVIAKVAATPAAKPAPIAAAAPAKTLAAVAAGKPVPAVATTKSATTAVAKTAATPATKPASGGAAVVQIGAYSSTALSDKGFADVSATMAGEMAGKSKKVEALDKDGKTLYRTSVAGFASRAAADAFCKALAAKGHICFAKS